MNTREIREFRRTLRQFERLVGVQLKNCCSGITLAQCLVLFEVEEHGRPNVGQLAARLRLDASTLTRTIDGLVKAGLVARSRSDEDRRAVWIELTPDGKALCRSVHSENDAYCRRVFDKIAPSRRAAAVRGFETLVQAYLACEAETKTGACCDAAATPVAGSKGGRSR